MNPYINVFQMPGVKAIIDSAQRKIKVLTGCDVGLQPVDIYSIDQKPEIIKLRQIVETYTGLPWSTIISTTRRTNPRYARYYYAWVSIKILKQTLEVTGDQLGSRDHTTVVNALRVMSAHIKRKDKRSKELADLIKLFTDKN